MFVRSAQYADNTPVAPASLQQTAAAWEPSVQQMVREIGGLEMAALEEAVATRWPFKYRVSKAWKAMDKISDTGLHRYLQHHWVIFRLAPVDAQDSLSARPDSQAGSSATEAPSEDLAPDPAAPQNLAPDSAGGTSRPAASLTGSPERTAWQHLPQKRNVPEEPIESQNPRPQGRSRGVNPLSSVDPDTLEPGKHESIQEQAPSNGVDHIPEDSKVSTCKKWQPGAPLEQSQRVAGAGVEEGALQSITSSKAAALAGGSEAVTRKEAVQEVVAAAIESQPSAKAAEQAQPADVAEAVNRVTEAGVAATAGLKQAGLVLADQGKVWFMRIDRFDKADKWFACPSFQDALLSDQARDQHFAPTSEVALEVAEGSPPIFIEYLVPLLTRLAAIKYSVIATGFHCQWHAKVVTKMAASIAFFVDPACVPTEHMGKVSAIVRDGKEQARYNSEAARFSNSAGSSYARTFPEAPFLKPTFQELKALATAQPGRVPPGLASRPWPDVFLIYRATGGA